LICKEFLGTLVASWGLAEKQFEGQMENHLNFAICHLPFELPFCLFGNRGRQASRPLTRPAPADESAGSGTPSPQGEGGRYPGRGPSIPRERAVDTQGEGGRYSGRGPSILRERAVDTQGEGRRYPGRGPSIPRERAVDTKVEGVNTRGEGCRYSRIVASTSPCSLAPVPNPQPPAPSPQPLVPCP
jgi:hypothetical protein